MTSSPLAGALTPGQMYVTGSMAATAATDQASRGRDSSRAAIQMHATKTTADDNRPRKYNEMGFGAM